MASPERVTDNDFLAQVLADGEWHGQQEILNRSINQRGHGLTVHSRVSDLRIRRGWTIEQSSRRTGSGRVASFYRMLARPLEEVASACDFGAASSSGSRPATGISSPGMSVWVEAPQSADPPVEPLVLFDDAPRGAYGPEAA